MERRAVIALLVAVFALAASAPDSLFGQTTTRLTPPPRELLLQLQRGVQSVKDGEFSDAVRQLGAVLAPPEESEPEFKQDYFTVGEKKGSLQSLRAQAESWIGQMPADGRKLYELRFGAEAKALLEKASKDFDVLALADCTRRYFHTEAGHEATLLLGQLHLDEGRPAAAAFCFRRLAQSPRAATFEPQASLLLAASWLYAGSTENAQRILIELKNRQPDLSLKAGDKDVKIFQNENDAVAWLKSVLASTGVGRSEFVEEWLTAHGNAERNAQANATPPVGSKNWRLPVANFPDDEQIVNDHIRDRQSTGSSMVPSLHALAMGDQVVMRTTRRVFGIDFATGKRVWEWPWDDEPDVDAENRLKIPNNGTPSNWSHDLSQRMWNDLPFGQLSSNGRSVFAISNLGVVPQSPSRIVFAVRNQAPTSNQLAALSLNREGALQWIVGGENGADEPQLAGAFFLGPPLPSENVLYTMAEIRDEVRLVALDPDTGVLKWQQQLAHVEGMGVNTAHLRRMAGAAPSLSSGVLVCPTAAGVVVAIDISSRSLLWAYEYKTKLKPGYRSQPLVSSANTASGPEWLENAPIIHSGAVIIAPPDSPWLYALDLLNGSPLWDPIKRGDHQFVGCVADDRIVLVGNTKVTARRLSDSEVIWETELPSGPSGRGVNTGALFLLPTTSSELLTIDLESGDIVKKSKTEYMLGNLVSFQDHIISHGANYLTAFHQVDHLREITYERLKENPKDAKGLRYKIMLHLEDEQYKQALETSLEAHQIYPDNAPIRNLLTRAVLDAFERDFDNTHQLTNDLADFMKVQPQYGEYLRRIAAGYATLGDYERSFESLMAFAKQAKVERSQEEELVLEGGAILTSNDRWIRQKSTELLELTADANNRERVEKLKKRLEVAGRLAVENQDWSGLARFLDQFSGYSAEAELQVKLAKHYYDQREYLRAQLMLGRITADMPHIDQGIQRAIMAHLLMRTKQFEQAAVLFHDLNDRWSDEVVWEGMTGSELFESVSPSAEIRVAAEQRVWPNGRVFIDKGAEASYSSNYPPVPFVQRRGVLTAIAPPYVRYLNNTLTITNGSGRLVGRASIRRAGQVFVSRTSQSKMVQAHGLGHLLVVSTGDEVFAVNALGTVNTPTENVLWNIKATVTQPGVRRTLTAKSASHPWAGGTRIVGPAVNNQLIGVIGPVTPHGVCFTRHTNVVCVDPITGREQWVHHNVGQGCDLFGDDELIFAVRDRKDEALVLRTRDGSAVGNKKVPKLTNRWATYGRNVLAWDNASVQIDGRSRLSRAVWLFDAWSDEEMWREIYSRDARGVVFDHDKVAIFEPEGGTLQVISLKDGKQLLTQKLPDAPKNVEHLVVKSVQGRLMVMLNEVFRNERTSVHPPVVTNAKANGKLYALSAEGELLWPTPVVLDRYYFVQDQPVHSPIMVFHRMGTTNLKTAKRYYSVLAIDLRDGRPLIEEHLTASHQMPMLCNVVGDRNEVTLRFARERRTIKFTDSPRPPGVPTITGKTAPVLDPLRAAAAAPRNPLQGLNLFPQKKK